MLEVASAITFNSDTVNTQNQNPAKVVTVQPVNQELPTKVKSTISSEQNEVDMGPWNIPKYNIRKRKNDQGQKINKASDVNKSKANSARGQVKTQAVVMEDMVQVELDVPIVIT